MKVCANILSQPVQLPGSVMSQSSKDPNRAFSDWQVFVVEYARTTRTPRSALLGGSSIMGTVEIPFSFVLARRADKVVLVDTGFMMEGRGSSLATQYHVTSWISPLRLLEELQVTADQVTDILISHAHFDHIGSIDKFPRAQLYIQKREFLKTIEALALPLRYAYLTLNVDPDNLVSALRAATEHRLTLLDGDTSDILPGLGVRLAKNGHCFGHQYVVVETPRGRVVVAGDCVLHMENLGGGNTDRPYVPLGSGVGNAWSQFKTFDRIIEDLEGDMTRLVILHDSDRWPHFEVHKEIEGFRIVKVA